MNEANELYERSRHDNVVAWREGSGQDGSGSNSANSPDPSRPTSGSGKDLEHQPAHLATKKNGSLPPIVQGADLTPNG